MYFIKLVKATSTTIMDKIKNLYITHSGTMTVLHKTMYLHDNQNNSEIC